MSLNVFKRAKILNIQFILEILYILYLWHENCKIYFWTYPLCVFNNKKGGGTEMRYQKKGVYKLLTIVLALTVLLTGCGGGAQSTGEQQSDEVIEWSFYSAYGPEDGACCEIWPRLFEEVKEATGGRLVIKTYWQGQHPYNGEDMLRALEEGTAQLAHFYSGYLSSVEPVFAVDSMPMLLSSDSNEAWDDISRLWGYFNQDKNGVLEDILEERWNASMVHMVPASPQRLFTVGYEADTIESLKGHKIRVYSPELSKLVQIMGGTPVSISFSEVYTSLATNLIDGLVTSVAFADSGGFFDYVDTINMWEIMAATDGLMVSLDALNDLPPDIRETFLKIMRESAMKPELLEINQNNEIVENLVQSGKVKVVVPTEEERAKLTELVKKEIWDPWTEKVGDDAKRVFDQLEN